MPFYEDYDFWVAVATLLLFVATLWLVVDGREGRKRELRAYIGVEPPVMSGRDPDQVVVTVANAGRTPAYSVRGHFSYKWIPVSDELAADFDFPDLGEPTIGTIAVLNPDKARPFTFQFDPKKLIDVRQGVTKLFLYGHFDYLDVFRRKQTARFLYRYFALKKDGQDVGHQLVMLDRHNDAT